MSRVQDETEVGGVERADDGSAIDHAGNLLQSLREFDVVDRRIDRWKRTEHVGDVHAGSERRVALRIERFGLGHAAGHPQDDDGVGSRRDLLGLSRSTGSWLRLRAMEEIWFPPGERRKGRAGG